MGERLHLTRTLGVSGWQTCAAEGNSFVLAALGICLLQPGTRLSLQGLWRLAQSWYAGLAAIDADELRLALCFDTRAKLAGVNVRVALALPSRATRSPRPFRFELRSLRRSARLPDAPAGRGWTVLRLAEGSESALARLVTALAAAPKGTRLRIDLTAQRTSAPDTLRTDFPLRVDALLDAQEGWFPLIRETRIDTARGGTWTNSTSRN